MGLRMNGKSRIELDVRLDNEKVCQLKTFNLREFDETIKILRKKFR